MLATVHEESLVPHFELADDWVAVLVVRGRSSKRPQWTHAKEMNLQDFCTIQLLQLKEAGFCLRDFCHLLETWKKGCKKYEKWTVWLDKQLDSNMFKHSNVSRMFTAHLGKRYVAGKGLIVDQAKELLSTALDVT